MMGKIAKYSMITFLVLLLAMLINYLMVIYSASAYTRKVVLDDIKNSRYRTFGQAPVNFELMAKDLSKTQREILIKVQDPGFYDHNGIDLSTPGAGLTTITQSIAKKLYFKKFKPGVAKIKQSLIARFVIDRYISKEDQITLFINSIYLGKKDGKSITGLKSAGEKYYGKKLSDLTEEEYISIIAMIVMPGTFHLIDHSEWNRDRSERIKAYVSGKYKPKGLMDQFYGDLPKEIVDNGLPPASYFGK